MISPRASDLLRRSWKVLAINAESPQEVSRKHRNSYERLAERRVPKIQRGLRSMSKELDEISQIMNDIESLQKEMDQTEDLVDAAPQAESSKVQSLSEFRREASADASMEETLVKLTMDSVDAANDSSLLNQAMETPSERKVEPMKKESSEAGQLTLSVSGSMNLKLKFESGDQEVNLSFEDDALKLLLSDGAEFKIPVRSARKAA